MKYNRLPRPLERDLGHAFKTLHDVLLMMENDDVDYYKGCHWGYVKSKTTLSKIIDVPADHTLRIESSDDCILIMKKTGRLASRFLTCIRHGFAHNCITYDSQSDFLSFDVNDSHGNLALQGKISHSALIEIINLIKESKNQTETK
ncbi:MAG: hypothetical protein K2K25_13165 [Muribaculaceae bacterium]|nr:hypothetical protein [Muribaculaceae bacterium]